MPLRKHDCYRPREMAAVGPWIDLSYGSGAARVRSTGEDRLAVLPDCAAWADSAIARDTLGSVTHDR